MDFYIDKSFEKIVSKIFPVVVKMTIYNTDKKVIAEIGYYEYDEWIKQVDDPEFAIVQIQDVTLPRIIEVVVSAIDTVIIDQAISDAIILKLKESGFDFSESEVVDIPK